jgi:predicted amidohydrolase
MNNTLKMAAVQLAAEVGNVDHNLAASERLAGEAAAQGAAWVVLPEFFSTGVGFRPELGEKAPGVDGEPTQLLRDLARRHGIHVGGSTIVRDTDGHVRNAFFLVGPDGTILGRHDKDLPTMWESALYTQGSDPGVVKADGLDVGVALCWELMRSQTLARLGGRVDLVVGGSGWWSMPRWPFLRRAETRNNQRATEAPAVFARHVGAPVVHAAHAGMLECRFLGTPLPYRGHFEGGTQICDADGRVLAFRPWQDGEGVVVADVQTRRQAPVLASDRFWLQPRGAVAAAAWTYQNAVGRRFYDRKIAAPGTADTGHHDGAPDGAHGMSVSEDVAVTEGSAA